MKLIHQETVTKNTDEFIKKVRTISTALGIDPNWLMQVMYSESHINPAAKNPYSGAIGLIQFMPDTASSLGTNLTDLANMSNVDQLDYVYKYLKGWTGKIKSYIDLYFSIFFPLAINKPLEWVFQAKNLSASLVAKQNPAFDLNGDGVLTVGEVQEAMWKMLPWAWRSIFKKKT
ncbi:MAG: transglycosylase SLT domain-containing protein [Candidatus Nanoarchaeia archaeon]|nr:transglycosylase SLT domain-containing protein [Candidatus Nanoarchaeia archaeon]